jgi:hypothetical protein
MTSELELLGLDGGNPLAFLAALGTLRTLTFAMPNDTVRMSWHSMGAWRPVLHANRQLTEDGIIQALHSRLIGMESHLAFSLGDNLEVAPSVFRQFAEGAAAASDRVWADFAAAFGCDAVKALKGKAEVIKDTALRTMSGAGHQHFFGFIRNIAAETTIDHLKKALFEPWRYDDPLKKLNMRWDPIDDSRYALRWKDPSKDGSRDSRGSVLGANRLAIEAMPLLPTAPRGVDLATTGFSGQSARSTFWTWPVWDMPVTLDVARSLVALAQLQEEVPPRSTLTRMGVAEVYRSQRLTVGKYRCFAPSQPV